MHHGPRAASGQSPEGGKTAERTWLHGKLLVAMPSMQDPRFRKSVIFLCAHDIGGAMGIVINQELAGVPLSLLLAQLSVTSEGFDSFPVLHGGPVDTARGLLLHTSDVMKSESIRIDRDFAVTGTIEALRDIVAGDGPIDKLFALGYAGWGPEQLETEISENSWLVADADPELVFRTSAHLKWDRALKKMGIDPAFLAASAGHA